MCERHVCCTWHRLQNNTLTKMVRKAYSKTVLVHTNVDVANVVVVFVVVANSVAVSPNGVVVKAVVVAGVWNLLCRSRRR